MKLNAKVQVFAHGFQVLQYETSRLSKPEIIAYLAANLIQPGTYEVKVTIYLIRALNLSVITKFEYKIPVTLPGKPAVKN